MEAAGFDFLCAVLKKPDIVVLTASAVEDMTCVQSEEALAASVVDSEVLVHNDEFNDGAATRTGSEGEGFVPGDRLFLSALDNFGLEFSGLSSAIVGFNFNVVFHFSKPVLALLEDSVSDGDFDLGHI